MNPTKMSLLAAAALFAVISLGGAGEMSAGSGFGGSNPYCHWYKQKAMATGEEYWWGRWRRCIRGNDWD